MTPDRPSDPPRRRIDLPGGPAFYTDEGAGPTVLLVHGLPGSARDWRWLGSALEPQLRVVRVDMPGFGETPLATGPDPSIAARADFVARFVAALGLDRPLVFGHSMGGVVVAAFAVRHPEAARGIGLLASVGHRPHASVRGVPRRAMSWALRVPGVASLARTSLARAMDAQGFRGHTHAQHVHTMHCLAALDFADHADNLARLRVPTLLAWTQDDPQVDAAIQEELYWRVPPGPRIRFPDGGHNLQKSRAVELAEAIAAWAIGWPTDAV